MQHAVLLLVFCLHRKFAKMTWCIQVHHQNVKSRVSCLTLWTEAIGNQPGVQVVLSLQTLLIFQLLSPHIQSLSQHVPPNWVNLEILTTRSSEDTHTMLSDFISTQSEKCACVYERTCVTVWRGKLACQKILTPLSLSISLPVPEMNFCSLSAATAQRAQKDRGCATKILELLWQISMVSCCDSNAFPPLLSLIFFFLWTMENYSSWNALNSEQQDGWLCHS